MTTKSNAVRAVLADREMELGPTDVIRHAPHWRLAIDEGGIGWLTLDREGDSTNTLSEEVIRELDEMLRAIRGQPLRALVIRSAKKGGFAAGADIRDFRDAGNAAELEVRMRAAHEIMDRLARMPMPTVAVIHGHCLGGGLELALACDYRFATPDAKLGFPEVLLGLHPGLGGTFRLTGLIDPIEAMTMMLSGKSAHAAKAKRLGLVDEVVEERHVADAVKALPQKGKRRTGGGLKSAAFSFKPARSLAARRMRAETEKRAPSVHYPAPHALIDIWEQYGGDARAMQDAEIRSFSSLLVGRAAQNLIRVFFLREKLRSLAKGQSGVRHVHVIGAGAMGADIASWIASRGISVTLADLDANVLAKAMGRASSFFDKKLHSAIERRDARDRLIPDFTGDGVSGADLVIEAIAEDPEIKRKVFADIASRMKPDAILASNTSSIPLEELARGLPEPQRLVGIHFFNPVRRMELVEVVSHEQAGEETLARARAFCGDIGKLPAPVRSSPGFLVNRALTTYMAEAFIMLDEGLDKETIDRAARDFGMPMGPIELADQVGLDIGLHVASTLREAFPNEVPEIPGWLQAKVDKGELGVKSGKGLYDYDEDGKPRRKAEAPAPTPEMADRLILPMLNSCVRMLAEQVVDNPETLDGAMIFGTGFAPFRGGPIHYARQRGINDVLESLRRLEARHGARFAPDPGWGALVGSE